MSNKCKYYHYKSIPCLPTGQSSLDKLVRPQGHILNPMFYFDIDNLPTLINMVQHCSDLDLDPVVVKNLNWS